jgi:DNA-binding transcriptional ArsR family regulator
MGLIDFSRKPTGKEKARLETRLRRLAAPDLPDHLVEINEKILEFRRPAGTLEKAGLRLRPGFSCRSTPIVGDSSDRKAPPRELRPPAMRVSSSTGSALRLHLIAIALLQLHRKPGAKARLANLEIPIAGDSQHTGWADLVAVQPTDSNVSGVFIKARDKRARTVRRALDTLEAAGLVDVPGQPGERNRYEDFVLLHEAGADARGEREEYTTPKLRGESVFAMPPGFVLNGWMHVLEDSEIAVLLMAACRREAWAEGDLWVFPGSVRLRHYGIHRDPFASARKTLEWLGLLTVLEVGRHDDGRAEDDERMAHRIGINPTGFEQPALPTMQEMIRWQLIR